MPRGRPRRAARRAKSEKEKQDAPTPAGSANNSEEETPQEPEEEDRAKPTRRSKRARKPTSKAPQKTPSLKLLSEKDEEGNKDKDVVDGKAEETTKSIHNTFLEPGEKEAKEEEDSGIECDDDKSQSGDDENDDDNSDSDSDDSRPIIKLAKGAAVKKKMDKAKARPAGRRAPRRRSRMLLGAGEENDSKAATTTKKIQTRKRGRGTKSSEDESQSTTSKSNTAKKPRTRRAKGRPKGSEPKSSDEVDPPEASAQSGEDTKMPKDNDEAGGGAETAMGESNEESSNNEGASGSDQDAPTPKRRKIGVPTTQSHGEAKESGRDPSANERDKEIVVASLVLEQTSQATAKPDPEDRHQGDKYLDMTETKASTNEIADEMQKEETESEEESAAPAGKVKPNNAKLPTINEDDEECKDDNERDKVDEEADADATAIELEGSTKDEKTKAEFAQGPAPAGDDDVKPEYEQMLVQKEGNDREIQFEGQTVVTEATNEDTQEEYAKALEAKCATVAADSGDTNNDVAVGQNERKEKGGGDPANAEGSDLLEATSYKSGEEKKKKSFDVLIVEKCGQEEDTNATDDGEDTMKGNERAEAEATVGIVDSGNENKGIEVKEDKMKQQADEKHYSFPVEAPSTSGGTTIAKTEVAAAFVEQAEQVEGNKTKDDLEFYRAGKTQVARASLREEDDNEMVDAQQVERSTETCKTSRKQTADIALLPEAEQLDEGGGQSTRLPKDSRSSEDFAAVKASPETVSESKSTGANAIIEDGSSRVKVEADADVLGNIGTDQMSDDKDGVDPRDDKISSDSEAEIGEGGVETGAFSGIGPEAGHGRVVESNIQIATALEENEEADALGGSSQRTQEAALPDSDSTEKAQESDRPTVAREAQKSDSPKIKAEAGQSKVDYNSKSAEEADQTSSKADKASSSDNPDLRVPQNVSAKDPILSSEVSTAEPCAPTVGNSKFDTSKQPQEPNNNQLDSEPLQDNSNRQKDDANSPRNDTKLPRKDDKNDPTMQDNDSFDTPHEHPEDDIGEGVEQEEKASREGTEQEEKATPIDSSDRKVEEPPLQVVLVEKPFKENETNPQGKNACVHREKESNFPSSIAEETAASVSQAEKTLEADKVKEKCDAQATNENAEPMAVAGENSTSKLGDVASDLKAETSVAEPTTMESRVITEKAEEVAPSPKTDELADGSKPGTDDTSPSKEDNAPLPESKDKTSGATFHDLLSPSSPIAGNHPPAPRAGDSSLAPKDVARDDTPTVHTGAGVATPALKAEDVAAMSSREGDASIPREDGAAALKGENTTTAPMAAVDALVPRSDNVSPTTKSEDVIQAPQGRNDSSFTMSKDTAQSPKGVNGTPSTKSEWLPQAPKGDRDSPSEKSKDATQEPKSGDSVLLTKSEWAPEIKFGDNTPSTNCEGVAQTLEGSSHASFPIPKSRDDNAAACDSAGVAQTPKGRDNAPSTKPEGASYAPNGSGAGSDPKEETVQPNPSPAVSSPCPRKRSRVPPAHIVTARKEFEMTRAEVITKAPSKIKLAEIHNPSIDITVMKPAAGHKQEGQANGTPVSFCSTPNSRPKGQENKSTNSSIGKVGSSETGGHDKGNDALVNEVGSEISRGGVAPIEVTTMPSDKNLPRELLEGDQPNPDPQSNKARQDGKVQENEIKISSPGQKQRGEIKRCDIQKIKILLFSAGSLTHRGRGFERLFSKYWGALSLIVAGQETGENFKLRRIVQSFLRTKRLRKLHNRLIMALIGRSLQETVPLNEISGFIPPTYRSRVRTFRTGEKSFEAEMKTTASSNKPLSAEAKSSASADKPSAVKETETKPKATREKSLSETEMTSSASTKTHKEFPLVVASVESLSENNLIPYTPLVSEDKVREGAGTRVSSNLPGALVVDPLVREIVQSEGMKVSEYAVWLFVVALNEHAISILGKTIQSKEARRQNRIVQQAHSLAVLCRSNTYPADAQKRIVDLKKKERLKTNLGLEDDKVISVSDLSLLSLNMRVSPADSLGGTISRLACERCIFAPAKTSQILGGGAFHDVHDFLTTEIETASVERQRLSKATTKEVPSKGIRSPTKATTSSGEQSSSQADEPAKGEDFDVPRPNAKPNPAVLERRAVRSPVQGLGRGGKNLGLGRGAKNLAALMARTAASSKPPTPTPNPSRPGGMAAPTSTTVQPPAAVQAPQASTQNSSTKDPEESKSDATALTTAAQQPAAAPEKKGNPNQVVRRGRGLGKKNLAFMRARVVTEAPTASSTPAPVGAASEATSGGKGGPSAPAGAQGTSSAPCDVENGAR